MAIFGSFAPARLNALLRELSIGLYALNSDNIARGGIIPACLRLGGVLPLYGDGTQNDDIRIYVNAPDQILLQRLVNFEWVTLQDISANPLGGSAYRAMQTPDETPDGIITTFTTPHEFVPQTLMVFVDGVAQDYTIADVDQFTLAFAPTGSEEVRASYYTEESLSGAGWGNIIGTLANQTDLQDALNAKQNTLAAGVNHTPTYSANFTSPTTVYCRYFDKGTTYDFHISATGTVTGTSADITLNAPINFASTNQPQPLGRCVDSGAGAEACDFLLSGSNTIVVRRLGHGNWGTGATSFRGMLSLEKA